MLKTRWGLFSLLSIVTIVIPLCIWQPFQQKRPFLRIPIVLSHEQPCIYATIEGKKMLFHLDSGSSDCFAINREILEAIEKKTLMEIKTWCDVQDNIYKSHRYIIPKIDINTFEVSNATAMEENIDFLFRGSKISKLGPREISNEEMNRQLTDISGRLGARTLRALDYWLLDLANNEIVAIRDIEKIKNTPGFSFDGFTEVALEKISPHIVITADTAFGKKKFALDIGASRSLLSPPSEEYENHTVLKMNPLMIEGKDFGTIKFYLFQMPSSFAFDGLLGRDFLEKHAVYLDFKNNRAFIGPSHKPI